MIRKLIKHGRAHIDVSRLTPRACTSLVRPLCSLELSLTAIDDSQVDADRFAIFSRTPCPNFLPAEGILIGVAAGLHRIKCEMRHGNDVRVVVALETACAEGGVVVCQVAGEGFGVVR